MDHGKCFKDIDHKHTNTRFILFRIQISFTLHQQKKGFWREKDFKCQKLQQKKDAAVDTQFFFITYYTDGILSVAPLFVLTRVFLFVLFIFFDLKNHHGSINK